MRNIKSLIFIVKIVAITFLFYLSRIYPTLFISSNEKQQAIHTL